MRALVLSTLLLLPASSALAGEIHTAVEEKNAEKVRALLAESPALRLETDDNKRTPLHLAALAGDLEMMELVMAPEALEAGDFRGATPLYVAVYGDHAAAVNIYIPLFSEVFEDGKKQVLLAHGAGIFNADGFGELDQFGRFLRFEIIQ